MQYVLLYEVDYASYNASFFIKSLDYLLEIPEMVVDWRAAQNDPEIT